MYKTIFRVLVLCLILSLFAGTVASASLAESLPTKETVPVPLSGLRCVVTELPLDSLDESQVQASLFSSSKTLTETLYEGCYAHVETINVSAFGLTTSDFRTFYYQFCMLYPELLLDTSWSWSIRDDIVQYIRPTYFFSAEDTPSQRQALQSSFTFYANKAKELHTEPLDQLLYIHDALILLCAYDTAVAEKTGDLTWEEALSFHCYGLFSAKKAVCQGYAQAFLGIARELGFEVSYCYNSGHIWNYIKLNGDWYHLDTTWDDSLVLGADVPNRASHDYFLCPDSAMEDHRPSQWTSPLYPLPECDSTQYQSGYLFNLPFKKMFVKKDGFYHLITSYISTPLLAPGLTSRLLFSAPQNGVIRYAHTQSPGAISIFSRLQDASGVSYGITHSLRDGERMFDGRERTLYTYELPRQTGDGSNGKIYFWDAETLSPLTSAISF